MGKIPPPRSLTKEEFEKFEEKYKPGKSIYDVDPELKKWKESGFKWEYNVGIFTILGISLFVLLFVVLSVI